MSMRNRMAGRRSAIATADADTCASDAASSARTVLVVDDQARRCIAVRDAARARGPSRPHRRAAAPEALAILEREPVQVLARRLLHARHERRGADRARPRARPARADRPADRLRRREAAARDAARGSPSRATTTRRDGPERLLALGRRRRSRPTTSSPQLHIAERLKTELLGERLARVPDAAQRHRRLRRPAARGRRSAPARRGRARVFGKVLGNAALPARAGRGVPRPVASSRRARCERPARGRRR